MVEGQGVHGDIAWLEPPGPVWIPNLVSGSAHQYSGDDHIVRNGNGLGLPSGSGRKIIKGNLGLGFALSQERFAEERFRIQETAFLGELIKSLITFWSGFVTVRDNNDPIFRKTSEFCSLQTGGEGGMMNDEQLGLCRVELV